MDQTTRLLLQHRFSGLVKIFVHWPSHITYILCVIMERLYNCIYSYKWKYKHIIHPHTYNYRVYEMKDASIWMRAGRETWGLLMRTTMLMKATNQPTNQNWWHPHHIKDHLLLMNHKPAISKTPKSSSRPELNTIRRRMTTNYNSPKVTVIELCSVIKSSEWITCCRLHYSMFVHRI